MANTDLVEAWIADLFRYMGFDVEPVPVEPDERRADFLAIGEAERCLVEVKTRFDEDDFTRELAERRLADASVTLGRNNSIDRVITKAESQLVRTPCGADYRVVCFVAMGMAPKQQLEALHATLYGTVELLDLDDRSTCLPCYYFDHAAFRRRPALDAVLAVLQDHAEERVGCVLHPNPFSPRASAFFASELARWCTDHDVFITDATAAEASGEAFIATDGEDTPQRLRAVQKKYGRPRLTPLRAHGFKAGAVVDLAHRFRADGD